jgi:hypothetical protein
LVYAAISRWTLAGASGKRGNPTFGNTRRF